MATAPDADVVSFLNTNVGALTTGTNLFRGKVRPIERTVGQAVFVLASGGGPPQAYGGQTSVETYFSGVVIRVRSANRDFSGGQSLARTVRDTVHHGALSGYINVRTLQSEPLYLGETDSGHHEWSINLELVHDE